MITRSLSNNFQVQDWTEELAMVPNIRTPLSDLGIFSPESISTTTVSSANAGITEVCIRPTESRYIVPFFNICLFIKILPRKTSNHDQAKKYFFCDFIFFGVSFPLNKFFCGCLRTQ